MSTPREGPNPLRPYYIPPSVGLPIGRGPTGSAASQYANNQASSASNARTSFGSSARDILSDLDYTEYLTDASPTSAEVIKGLVDQALWRYTSVLLAQPFEVAKTVLQVQLAGSADDSAHGVLNDDMRRRPERYREEFSDTAYDDSDSDEVSYFTSTAPAPQTPSRSPRRRGRRSHGYHSPSPQSPESPVPRRESRHSNNAHHIPTTTSIHTVISHLWSSEGAWGIWKGTNSTFIHGVLLSTITAFARSLICAVLALPDPGLPLSQSSPSYLIYNPSAVGGLDVLSSASPLLSLAAAVSAAGIAGMILAPLDIVRTKLMLTPSTHPPRSLIPTLQSLPSWTLPFSIAPVTFLHSTLPTLISASTPLVLRTRLGIDPVLTPSLYSIATFASQVIELGVRLPIETVLRRGQMAVVASPSSTDKFSRATTLPTARPEKVHTIVEPAPYKGLIGTAYYIVFEEGSRGDAATHLVNGRGGAAVKSVGSGKIGKRRKGQGLGGLWRGWRVGMWGLVGVWGAATLGGVGGKGGEF
ncbi:mitochondrial fusion and transport protein ugo1 [Xylographa carneopallida]|nr:mitochondrial fusion and transport protein ugo1 [Xylographa carneopallida]